MYTDVYAFGSLLWTICLLAALPAQDKMGHDWPTVKRGMTSQPVEFTREGSILFKEGTCQLEISKEDETTEQIQFSPVSPDGEYRVVIGDVYDSAPAYLVAIKKCGVMHLAVPRYFLPWFSWAPDGKHVLLYSDYEASPQLWVLGIETGQLFEVHKANIKVRADTCCGLNEWAPKSGVGYLVPESVHWNNPKTVSFRLEIYCSPYSEEGGWPCVGVSDQARAAYSVSVDLERGTVNSGPRITLPLRGNQKKEKPL